MYRYLPKANIDSNTASLRIQTSVGVMVNYVDWQPVPAEFDYKDIAVEVNVDGQCIGQEVGIVECQFEDQTELALHELKIKVTGFGDQHNKYIEGVGNCALMIRFDCVQLENLNLRQALEDYGQAVTDNKESFVPSEFLGHNGTITLEFTSPVYQWLLNSQNSMLYYQDVNNDVKDNK